MRLSDYVALLRRSWYVVVAGALLGLLVGAVAQYARTPGYTSQVTMYANSDKADYVQVSQSTSLALQRMTSYAALVGTTSLADQIRNDLSLTRTSKAIASGMSASLVKDTVMMKATTTAPTREEAANIAQDLPTALNKVIAKLSTDNSSANKVTFNTVTGPVVSKTRSLPKLALSMLFGLLIGSALGAALAILLARLRRTLRSPDEAQAITGRPVIGILPALKVEGDALGVQTTREERDFWDANRRLGQNLEVLEGSKVVAVTSPGNRADSTSVARGLAAALASRGDRVLLIDRGPDRDERSSGDFTTAATTFGMAELGHIAESPRRKGLFVAPSHLAPTTPTEWRTQLQTLSADAAYDRVVVDAPTVLLDVDAAAVQNADAVLLVVTQNRTRRDDVTIAAESLRATGVDNVAVVIRDVVRSSVPHSQLMSGLSLPADQRILPVE